MSGLAFALDPLHHAYAMRRSESWSLQRLGLHSRRSSPPAQRAAGRVESHRYGPMFSGDALLAADTAL
jgi:hypothetical protein